MYRKIIYERYLSSINISLQDIEDNFNQNIFLDKMIEYNLTNNKEAKVLDLGCGNGSLLNTLKKRGYKNLFGVEIGVEQNIFLRNKGFQIQNQDIINYLETNNEAFDVIFLFDVLEHFNKNEIVKIIPLLKNKLRTNGKIFLRVPNAEAIFKGSIMYGDFTHETFFTKRSLLQIFNIYQFKKIEIYPVYPPKTASWKSQLSLFIYKGYETFYRFLLARENKSSLEYFLSTQNILAIIQAEEL
jgi:2-polyprenyl-3-methyl-5-hydroxy-6-metoxy-1,4-benzoquinol methylase